MGRYVALLRGINVGGKNPIPMKLFKEAFEYYPKLGFKRGYELGLTLPDGSSPDALMAYELKEGSLAGGGVCKFLAPEYGKAEADDITGFHRAFINENYGGKLILRKLSMTTWNFSKNGCTFPIFPNGTNAPIAG